MPPVDDQQTYLLNGLIARNFGIGRIVRFRPVQRGRQAECFELFTAEEREYLVQLFAPAYGEDQLDFAAGAVNTLDRHCFSVMPYIASKNVVFVAEGPQNSHMVLSLAPAGSAMNAAQFSDHDISQVGLRLAWMHRLLLEQLPRPGDFFPLTRRLPTADGPLEQLHGLLALPTRQGWVHGDLQPAALLHDVDHQLRAVTDWGLLHWGCPLEDVVDAFIALATDAKGAFDRRRGVALLEAYDSLVSIKRTPWTPVVASWCAQRLIDQERRPLAEGFMEGVLPAPERLATAMASCF
jgi:aminoglycoside phosphotransferase (APT) family kinase protein